MSDFLLVGFNILASVFLFALAKGEVGSVKSEHIGFF